MLDSGSTLTMVTSRLVNSLNLKKFRKSIINVKGFCGLTPSTREVELVLRSSQPRSTDQMFIRAHVVDDIPQTAVTVPMKTIKEISFIHDLNLADPDFDADGQVDLLLGQEHAVRCERPGAIYSPDGDLRAGGRACQITGCAIMVMSMIKIVPVARQQ